MLWIKFMSTYFALRMPQNTCDNNQHLAWCHHATLASISCNNSNEHCATTYCMKWVSSIHCCYWRFRFYRSCASADFVAPHNVRPSTDTMLAEKRDMFLRLTMNLHHLYGPNDIIWIDRWDSQNLSALWITHQKSLATLDGEIVDPAITVKLEMWDALK